MQRRDLNANDAPPPAAAYTQAIEVTGATRTLYISGQVGRGWTALSPPISSNRAGSPGYPKTTTPRLDGRARLTFL